MDKKIAIVTVELHRLRQKNLEYGWFRHHFLSMENFI